MNTTIEQTEPAQQDSRKPVWIRGLYMLFFIVAIGLAQTLINLMAVVQFMSMLLLRETNAVLASFGNSLGAWMAQTAQFQSGASEDKPFPWAPWPSDD